MSLSEYKQNPDYVKMWNEIRNIVEELYEQYKEISPEYKFSEDVTKHTYINGKTGSYVYFIKNKYNNLVKVGSTNNIVQRFKTIKSICKNYIGMEDAVELVGLIDTSFIKPIEVEKYFHKKYKQYNKFGEWFDFPTNVWNSIKRLYFFDFEFDDTINEEERELFNLGNNIHGINFVGNPCDNEFMELLYGRYKNESYNNKELDRLTDIVIQDIFHLGGISFDELKRSRFYEFIIEEYFS